MNTIMNLYTDYHFLFEWSKSLFKRYISRALLTVFFALHHQTIIMLEIIPSDLSVANITSLSAREPIKEDEIFILEELEKDNLSSFSASTLESPCSLEDDNSQYCLQCGTEFVEKEPHQNISGRSTCDSQVCNGCRK